MLMVSLGIIPELSFNAAAIQNFNDGTGWYERGDVRWVRANHTYGPEESGPDGCEFILISMGPIDVQWESGDTYQANA